VRVGGGPEGPAAAGPVARTVTVTPATTLRADAGSWGGGGRVAVWSEQATDFYGAASARGGRAGGPGGLIEVSAKGTVTYGGSADAAAPAGRAGTLLLDPKDLVISNHLGMLPQFSLINPHPTAGGRFGTRVQPLSTGNVVVTDPNDDLGGSRAGAAYLFDGGTGALLSSLVGSNSNDQVGSEGATPLSGGNYVLRSTGWNGGRGAATWGSGAAGVSGAVSAANSLVGSNPGDGVGGFGYFYGVFPLSNGNYVVRSPDWNGGRGGVTWGSGAAGVSGAVSAANSLVGSNPGDQVGAFGISALGNGNYVVFSPFWNGNRGAVTWGSGAAGVSGPISAANSLVGSNPGDQVGSTSVTPVGNGNYVVGSAYWNGNRGAATWGSGVAGVTGVVSEANSLVGSNPGDYVGSRGITVVGNGNYVCRSPGWNGGRGAVTWGDGTAGVTGTIDAGNSLVGSNPGDSVGDNGIALSNGNYVVASSTWNGGRGAATWGSGAAGVSGPVSAANSLVGSVAGDRVGSYLAAVGNGNYVVNSFDWNGNRGAATWGSGATGVNGPVSEANSLSAPTPGTTSATSGSPP
jgi:hypothetical protein